MKMIENPIVDTKLVKEVSALLETAGEFLGHGVAWDFLTAHQTLEEKLQPDDALRVCNFLLDIGSRLVGKEDACGPIMGKHVLAEKDYLTGPAGFVAYEAPSAYGDRFARQIRAYISRVASNQCVLASASEHERIAFVDCLKKCGAIRQAFRSNDTVLTEFPDCASVWSQRALLLLDPYGEIAFSPGKRVGFFSQVMRRIDQTFWQQCATQDGLTNADFLAVHEHFMTMPPVWPDCMAASFYGFPKMSWQVLTDIAKNRSKCLIGEPVTWCDVVFFLFPAAASEVAKSLDAAHKRVKTPVDFLKLKGLLHRHGLTPSYQHLVQPDLRPDLFGWDLCNKISCIADQWPPAIRGCLHLVNGNSKAVAATLSALPPTSTLISELDQSLLESLKFADKWSWHGRNMSDLLRTPCGVLVAWAYEEAKMSAERGEWCAFVRRRPDCSMLVDEYRQVFASAGTHGELAFHDRLEHLKCNVEGLSYGGSVESCVTGVSTEPGSSTAPMKVLCGIWEEWRFLCGAAEDADIGALVGVWALFRSRGLASVSALGALVARMVKAGQLIEGMELFQSVPSLLADRVQSVNDGSDAEGMPSSLEDFGDANDTLAVLTHLRNLLLQAKDAEGLAIFVEVAKEIAKQQDLSVSDRGGLALDACIAAARDNWHAVTEHFLRESPLSVFAAHFRDDCVIHLFSQERYQAAGQLLWATKHEFCRPPRRIGEKLHFGGLHPHEFAWGGTPDIEVSGPAISLVYFVSTGLESNLAVPHRTVSDFRALERAIREADVAAYLESLTSRSELVCIVIRELQKLLECDDLGKVASAIPADAMMQLTTQQLLAAMLRVAEGEQWRLRKGVKSWFGDVTESTIRPLAQVAIAIQAREAQMRIDERNRVIADLSHHIKNLVARTTSSLEDLKARATQISGSSLEHALRGARLIREIVQAMNLSYRGTANDLVADGVIMPAEGATGLTTLALDAACAVIPDMFDTKYFSSYSRNYFPAREVFMCAREAWSQVLAKRGFTLNDVMRFARAHMLDLKIDVHEVESLGLRDAHGCRVKMLILLNELMLNAIRHASYLPREERWLLVSIKRVGSVRLTVSNPYVRQRGERGREGLGREIVHNIVSGFGGRLVEDVGDEVYTVNVEIKNVWEVA